MLSSLFQVKCINGCEVLVTTPRCLIKLLQFSTNLHRLGVFVLDNADILLSKFLTEVRFRNLRIFRLDSLKLSAFPIFQL